jgi:hypothetical protein
MSPCGDSSRVFHPVRQSIDRAQSVLAGFAVSYYNTCHLVFCAHAEQMRIYDILDISGSLLPGLNVNFIYDLNQHVLSVSERVTVRTDASYSSHTT